MGEPRSKERSLEHGFAAEIPGGLSLTQTVFWHTSDPAREEREWVERWREAELANGAAAPAAGRQIDDDFPTARSPSIARMVSRTAAMSFRPLRATKMATFPSMRQKKNSI